jgi:hypothetical protein
LVVSAILGIVAAALPARSTGTVIVKVSTNYRKKYVSRQIGLIYLGIALEGVVHIFHLCKSLRQPLSVETIGHRYGCLTLIILCIQHRMTSLHSLLSGERAASSR